MKFRGTAVRLLTAAAMLAIASAAAYSQPLSVTAAGLSNVTVNFGLNTYYFGVFATGGTPPYHFSVDPAHPLPPGLTFNPGSTDASIDGTPTTVGNYTTIINVTDSAAGSVAEPFYLNVFSGPLQITTTSVPDATMGSAYSYTTVFTGGVTTYSQYTNTGGPPGLHYFAEYLSNGQLTGNYYLNGMCNTVAANDLTISVTDASFAPMQATATKTFPGVGCNPAPQITNSATLPSGTPGTAYSATFATNAQFHPPGAAPYTWAISASNLPATLTFDAVNGKVSGTPTTTGSYSFTVTFTDRWGATTSKTFQLEIVTALSVTTTALPDATLNTPYHLTAASTGGTSPYTWSATGLPAGLSIAPATGAISGSCTATGTGNVTLTALDSTAPTPLMASQTVNGVGCNPLPAITNTSPLPSGTMGTAYSVTFATNALYHAPGAAPYTWAISGSNLPATLTFNAAAGKITGTPTTTGSYSFTITFTDRWGATTNKAFTLIVGSATPLSVTTTALPDATLNTAYNVTTAATGGTSPYHWSATGLPAGLSIAPSTGVISGSCTATGTSNVTLTVTDSATPNAATASQTINGVGCNPLPVITNASPLPSGTVNVAYPVTFTTNALYHAPGAAPYTWAISGSNLPATLTFNAAAGTIAGTPTAAGNYSFSLAFTDRWGATATKSFQLSIAAPTPVSLTSTSPLPAGHSGTAYSNTLTYSGGVAPVTFTGTGLPAWLGLNSSTGVLSGTPPAGGAYTFTVQLTDSAVPASSSSKSYTLVVNAPTITDSSSLPAATQTVSYSHTFAATGGSGGYTWSASSLPSWLTITPAGVLSGTPPLTAPGVISLPVTVTDSLGAFATTNFVLVINVPPLMFTTTTPLPPATVGQPYTTVFQATGGYAPYEFLLVPPPSLPAWLTLGFDGTLSGTPPSAGPVTFTVQVLDDGSSVVNLTVTLPVNAVLTVSTTSPLPPATAGAAYSQTLTASGGSGGYHWTATGLPSWLSLSSAGALTGTPPASASVSFTATVTDSSSNTASRTFTITVNSALTIGTASPLPPATVAQPYMTTLAASGGTGSGYSWSATGLPSWLSLSTAGVFSGTPTASGSVTIAVTVTDSGSNTATRNFMVPVNAALVMGASSPLPAATVGSPYSYNFTASGGSGGYVWSPVTLPSWLTITAAGYLSGTPTVAGPVTLTVSVKDSINDQLNRTFTLPVNAGVTIQQTSPLPSGVMGSAYSLQFSAAGGTGGYLWSATGVPAGLTLSSGGLLSGTPAGVGTATLSVTVTDSSSSTAAGMFLLTINAALAVTTTSLPDATLNTAYNVTAAASGGIGPYSWSATGLPTGLSIAPATGVISGSCTATGSANVTLKVTDYTLATASQVINGVGCNPLPLITNTSPLSATVNTAYSVAFTTNALFHAPGASPYTWAISASNLPATLTFNAATGTIGGTPTSTGSYSFTITFTDRWGATTQKNFVLNVGSGTPLSVTTTALPDATLNTPYNVTAAAAGGVPSYSWSATGLPAGLSIAPNSGVISGSCTATGTSNVTLKVTDGASATATQTINGVGCNPLPLITNTSPLLATVNTAYSVAFTTNALSHAPGASPYTWAISASNLPATLTFNAAAGTIGGTPTSTGSYSFTITFTDRWGATTQKTFTLNVGSGIAPSITDASPLADAPITQSYTHTFAASGGTGLYTWTASGLPSWLSITSGGVLSGTPPASFISTSTFAVTVTDSFSASATKSFALSTTDPVMFSTTSPLPAATVGQPYTTQIQLSGNVCGGALSSPDLPSWLTLDAVSGSLTGTPPSPAGSVTFTLNVIDDCGGDPTLNVTLPVNVVLTVNNTSPLPPATMGAAYSQTLTASGGSGGYTWTATGLPGWLSLSSAGALTGTPPTAAPVSFTVTVKDSSSNTASRTFAIAVNSALVIGTASPLPPATATQPYLTTLAASGGTGSGYSWSATGLPAWLSLSTAGVLSGTPTAGGAVTLAITVTDSGNNTAVGNFTLPVNSTLVMGASATLPAATVGSPYSFNFTVSGGSGGYVWAPVSLPSWLTITAAGFLSGTPPVAGPVSVSVSVKDSINDQLNGTFTLPVNVGVAIQQTSPLPSALVGSPYFLQFSATGGTGGYTWSATGLPAGLTISSSGLVVGTPTAPGTATLSVTVTDSGANSAMGLFTLVLNGSLQIQQTSLPGGLVGSPYSLQFSANGGTGGYAWSATGVPTGLTLSSGGLLSGTPTASGTVSLSVTVADSFANTATRVFTLAVNAPVTIQQTSPLPGGLVGSPYSLQFSASGGTGGYTWSATGVPSGLTLSSGGLLSGTPTAPGSSSLSVTVTDSSSHSAVGAFTLVVTAAVQIQQTSPLPGGLVGSLYSLQFSANGGTGGYAWSATGVPAGLTLSSGGLLSGTPTVAGTASLSVTVTDSSSHSAVGAFTLVVTAAVQIQQTSPLPGGLVGSPYSLQFSANGGTGGYAWSATGVPSGLTLSSGGLLSGTPTVPGTASLSVTVTDSSSHSAIGTYTLVVLAPVTITGNATLPPATVGSVYSFTFQATGGTPAYSWTATGLPGWLSLSSVGALTGTPPSAGSSTISVTVSDSASGTATRQFTLPAVAPLAIATPSVLPAATIAQSYTATFSATGGSGAGYTWSGTGLPAWLTLSPAGALSGTPPSGVTAQSFAVKVTDSANNSTTQTFTLPINGALLILGAASLSPGVAGIPYSYTFSGSGGSGSGYTWSASGLPAWLGVSGTGVLSGTPPAAGTYGFSITLRDSVNNALTRAFTLPVNAAVAISQASPLAAAVVNVPYTLQFSATGGLGGYTWQAAGLPSGLSLSGAGLLTGTAAVAGSLSFQVTVTDMGGNAAVGTFTLPVLAALSVTTLTLSPATVGVAYSANLSAAGGTGTYTWSGAGLPGWLSIGASGVLTGTPPAGGSVSFSVTVRDSANNTASQSLTLIVNAGLTVTTTTLPAGTVGSAYSATLSAAGGTGTYTWSGAGLPGWLSLSAAGSLTGTPSTAGSVSFTATVKDSASNTASQSLTLLVNAGLTVTTTTLPAGTVGSTYSTNLSAAGGTGTYAWSAAGLPGWLTLSAAGSLTGTPPTAGSVSFTATVRDSASNTASQSLTLIVNAGLTVTTTALPSGTVGSTYSTNLSAAGGTGTYAWSAAGLPGWLTLSAAGSLTGTPPTAGSVSFTATVRDSANNTASQSLTLIVNAGLSVTTMTLPAGTVGSAYSATLSAAGGTGTYAWSATGLPGWLTLSAAGSLSGTPPTAGSINFTATVTDSANNTASQSLTLLVNSGLTVTTTTLPVGTVGSTYSTNLSAAGGTGTYTWSGAGLPGWLSLSAAGSLAGTPPIAGAVSFTVTVKDSANNTASQSLTLLVNSGLTVTTTTLPVGTVGSTYSTNLSAAGGTGTYAWSATGLPGWVTLSAAGSLSGTPPTAGSINFTATVTDSANNTASQSLTLLVNSGLTIATTTLPAGIVGSAYSATLSAAGGTGAYTWSGTTLPVWLTLNASGILTGTPPSAGSINFTATVTDSTNSSASQSLTLLVNAPIVIQTTSPLPPAFVGMPYGVQFMATGGSGILTWSGTNLPAGLTLSPAGFLSGTPAAAGLSSLTVSVTDSANSSASGAFGLTIFAPLTIAGNANLPGGTAGSAYSQQFVAVGGAGPYTWTATGLPTGLSLNSAGVLSGTPAAAGTLAFAVTVTDGAGNTATRQFTLAVVGSLVITTATLPSATVGAAYTTSLTAAGGAGNYTWSAVNLPVWLTLSASGTLSGTPPSAAPVNFSATVKDAANSTATQSFTLPVNTALAIVTTTLPPAAVGRPYSANLTAAGGTGTYTWSAANLPVWLTLSANGNLTGTPPSAGPVSFTANVTDSGNRSASQLLTLQVNSAPASTTTTLPPGTVGLPYSTNVSATGGTGPYTWSGVNLPSWLNLTAAGALSGTPPSAGPINFSAIVTDSANNSASESFILTVNPALSITTTTLPAATVSSAYSTNLTATGGTGTYSWSANNLPAWLTLSPSGTLAGTPPSAGPINFTATLRDSVNNTASQSFTLTVNPALSITMTTLPAGTVSSAYSTNLTATGGTGTYSWSATTLPAWLTLSTSGTLSGTPPSAGPINFTATVKDSVNNTASQSFTLSVNGRLTITTATLPTATVGVFYSASLSASGGTGIYTWSATNLPSWLALTASGALIGAPPNPGPVSFTATVKDSANSTASQTLNLQVAPADVTPSLTIVADLPSGAVGSPYSGSLQADSATGSVAWQILSGSLPPGLNLGGSGAISGTPTTAGSFPFSVQATAGSQISAQSAFTILIAPPPPISVATPAQLPAGIAQSTYQLKLAATGGAGIYTWSIVNGSLPNGLSLAGDGTLSGTPTSGGTSTFTATVQDTAQDRATRQFTLLIAGPTGPAITSFNPLPDGIAGQPYSTRFAAIGGQRPLFWAVPQGALPDGLTFDSFSGILSGTPTQSGVAAFTLAVTDAAAASSNAGFTLHVTAPGVFAITASLLPANPGAPYATTLTSTGGTGPIRWLLSAGLLPVGLSLSDTGMLAGTPAAPGIFPLTVQAFDSAGASATAALTLLVIQPGTPMLVLSGTLPDGLVSSPYSQPLPATGGQPPYTWSIADGNLPDGLTFDSSTGQIGGLPSQSGVFTFSVQVADSAKATARQSYTLTVLAPGLTITTPPDLPPGFAGVAYSFPLDVTGGTPPYHWSLSAGQILSGLSVSPTKGVLDGTPALAGAARFTVSVTDSSLQTSSQTFTLTTQATALAISTPQTSFDAVAGATVNIPLTTLSGTPPFLWSITDGQLPPGLSLDSTNGNISGSPTDPGTYTVTVSVTDVTKAAANRTLTFVVAPAFLNIVTAALPAGVAGQPYSYVFRVTGAVGTLTWSAPGSLPGGLSLDPASGTLAGTPSTPGDYSFTIAAKDQHANGATQSVQLHIDFPPLPTAHLSGLPAQVNSATTQTVSLDLEAAYVLDLTVTARLQLTPDLSGGASDLAFANGSRQIPFTLPAGSRHLDVPFQTGTVAGAIQVTVGLQPGAGPAESVVLATQIAPAAPVLSNVSVTTVSGGFQIQVMGYSNTREVKSATFHFTAAPGQKLQVSDFTVDVASTFAQWFANPQSASTGGRFTLTVPFSLGGAESTVASVAVTLQNSVGSSEAVTIPVR